MSIPKTIFQTARSPLPPYLVQMILSVCPDYTYEFYDDAAILTFFRDYPLREFPNIIHVFHSLREGEHKADLFRYYYLFVKGGIYLDNDAMIYQNIDSVVNHFDFFSVDSFHKGTIFQGIIGSSSHNLIVYNALVNMYIIHPPALLRDYYINIKDLYQIIHKPAIVEIGYKIKLYTEIDDGDKALVVDSDNTDKVIFIHFWKNKTIPIHYRP